MIVFMTIKVGWLVGWLVWFFMAYHMAYYGRLFKAKSIFMQKIKSQNSSILNNLV